MKTEISVIIPTYNRINLLKQTLDALLNQSLDKNRFEILIVNDGSEDETSESLNKLKKRASPIIRTYYQERKFAGVARNLGILNAESDIILLIDDDVLADVNLLQQHLLLHKKHESNEIVIIGRLITPSSKMDLIRTVNPKLEKLKNDNFSLHYRNFRTANVSLKKHFIIQAGLFTPGLPCLQDTELAMRLNDKGMKLLYCREAFGIHLMPIDTLKKVVNNGGKYGRACAELYNQIPDFAKELYCFGGRLNGGWDHFIHHPMQYVKDAVRRWFINKHTINFIVYIAQKKYNTQLLKKLMFRFYKEIWSFNFRYEFLKRKQELKIES